jgi:hypothetical protein
MGTVNVGQWQGREGDCGKEGRGTVTPRCKDQLREIDLGTFMLREVWKARWW